MPTAITGALARLKDFVGRFTVVQKTFAIILVAALVLGAVALGSWMLRPKMSPLFTGLSASDANQVVEQLDSAGVQYELTDGGASILVPRDQVYSQRLAAAADGLPTDSSGGYTLLDDMGVTSSEFQQSVTYKRAIEGEIAHTISAMDGVNNASVQLAIPEESVFVSEKQDPTASIFVETASGVTLSREQVDAIVHLTSSAVSGMDPIDVSVVDQAGTVLSAAGTGQSGSASDQASEYETRVTQNVQKMLDGVLGTGNSRVTVAADVSNATSERVDETYEGVVDDNGDPITSNQKETSETYTGTGGTEAGVLGPDNIAAPADENGTGDYESTETTNNNVINKSTERVDTPAGAVTRQTVSVAVNAGAMEGVTTGQIQDIVTAAAGIDTERGDAINVSSVAFSTADADAAAAALAAQQAADTAAAQGELIRTGIIAGAIAIPLIILALIIGIRRRRRTPEEPAAPALDAFPENPLFPLDPEDGGGAETIVLTQVKDDTAPTTVLNAEPEPDPGPEPEQVKLERERLSLEQAARRDPEKTAEALRTMMLEGSTR